MGSERKYGGRTRGIGKYIVIGLIVLATVAVAIWYALWMKANVK